MSKLDKSLYIFSAVILSFAVLSLFSDVILDGAIDVINFIYARFFYGG